MVLRNKPILSILSTTVIFTFLWSQIVFALELPDHPLQNNITFQQSQQKNLPINLHKLFQKQLSRLQIHSLREKIKPTLKYCLIAIYAKPNPQNQIQNYTQTGQYDRLGRIDEKYGRYDNKSYKWQAISYDELGRPTAYKEKIGKVSYRHYDILYNELGDVSYEKIKVTSKSGGLIKSKTTVVTEYKYSYDEYGMREKIWENEIYRKTSTPFIGKIIQAAIAAVTAVFTAGQSLWVIAAWMAASSFVSTLIMTGDIRQALLSAAISYAASVVSSFIQGALTGTLDALLQPTVQRMAELSFSNFFKEFVKQFVTSEVYDFMAARGPPFLAYLASALIGRLFNYAMPMHMIQQVGNTWISLLPPELSQLFSTQALIGDLISAGITQLIDDAVKDGRISTDVARVLRAVANAVIQAMIQNIIEQMEEKARIEELKRQGHLPTYDATGKLTGWINGEENSIIYLNPDGTLKYQQIYDDNANLIAIKEPGKITYFDERGIPVYTLLDNGYILSYDMNGNPEGWLVPGGQPKWDKQGQFTGSYIDSDKGTVYFDKEAKFEAFVPKDNEIMQNRDGRIVGSYTRQDGTTIIYDHLGRFDSSIIPVIGNKGDTIGYFVGTPDTLTYTDAEGIRIWDTSTTDPNAPINYYGTDGTTIIGKLETFVSAENINKGFIYTDLETQTIRKYDTEGNYEGVYRAKTNNEGEVTGYYGYNKDSNYTYLDRNFDRIYEITPTGKTIIYGLNPNEIDLVLPQKVYQILLYKGEIQVILGEGDNGLGFYDKTGNIISPENYNKYETIQRELALSKLEKIDKVMTMEEALKQRESLKIEGLGPFLVTGTRPNSYVFLTEGLNDKGERIYRPLHYQEVLAIYQTDKKILIDAIQNNIGLPTGVQIKYDENGELLSVVGNLKDFESVVFGLYKDDRFLTELFDKISKKPTEHGGMVDEKLFGKITLMRIEEVHVIGPGEILKTKLSTNLVFTDLAVRKGDTLLRFGVSTGIVVNTGEITVDSKQFFGLATDSEKFKQFLKAVGDTKLGQFLKNIGDTKAGEFIRLVFGLGIGDTKLGLFLNEKVTHPTGDVVIRGGFTSEGKYKSIIPHDGSPTVTIRSVLNETFMERGADGLFYIGTSIKDATFGASEMNIELKISVSGEEGVTERERVRIKSYLTNEDIQFFKDILNNTLPDINTLPPGYLNGLEERVKMTIAEYIKIDTQFDPYTRDIILIYIDPYYIPIYDTIYYSQPETPVK